MQIHLHQTHHDIADFTGIGECLKSKFASKTENKGIHLFPELFLTGYPLQDLVLQRSFINNYLEFLEDINAWSLSQPTHDGQYALIGGLSYCFDEKDLPYKIENVIFLLIPGQPLEKVYSKILLPNYDIFDEEKYFSPGEKAKILQLGDQHVGLLICEDMWVSSHHDTDPVKDLFSLAQSTKKLDLIVNLSGSPFHLGKEEKRHQRGKEISSLFQVPFYYVNRVGGEDEVLFDGGSFAVHKNELLYTGNLFHEDSVVLDVPKATLNLITEKESKIENTWEDLFKPNLDLEKTPPQLYPLKDQHMENLIHALSFGLQEYAEKCGFKKFLVALSGGIDSALVLTLAKMALKEGQSLEAVYMPSIYSSTESYELSDQLCQNLGVPLKILPIKFFHASMRNAFQDVFGETLEGLSDENIQSRLRGTLLYARSNQTGAMVINTSNKSELAVGYSTLYGDSVGAISLLGDLYKSEVFELAKFINKKCPGKDQQGLIPEGIITREPSAELRPDQTDSQSLPKYELLDAMLEGILSYRMGLKELHDFSFPLEDVKKVYGLYTKSEYKRRQFCPIIKVRAKSFGFGYRVPICKKTFL